MLHASLKYKGETEYCKGNRIALLTCPVSEEAKMLKVLTMINAEYPDYLFDNLSDDGETVEYYVRITDKEDFQVFSAVWKEFKKNA